MSTIVTAFINAPIAANTALPIYDSMTLEQVELPAGAVLVRAILHQISSLEYKDDPTFSIGGSGYDAIPASAGALGSVLAAGDIGYTPAGLLAAPTSATALALTSTQALTAGSVGVSLEYVVYTGSASFLKDFSPKEPSPKEEAAEAVAASS